VSKSPQFLAWCGIGLLRVRVLQDEEFNDPIKQGLFTLNMIVERHCLDAEHGSEFAHAKTF
jgi:hypothetical protein